MSEEKKTEKKQETKNENVTETNTYEPELRLDILKGFGADLDLSTRENLLFINRALVYPIGKHLLLRDILTSEGNSKNDVMFIYLDDDIENITCLNTSRDNYLLLTANEYKNKCGIDIYNLAKINFASYTIYKPRRRVLSTEFKRFIYSSFSQDGNLIAAIGESQNNILKGLIYDVQSYKKFKDDNYPPKASFDLPSEVTKISFYNSKVLCTSGKNHLSFWFIFENTCKEYKATVNLSKNYIDHIWVFDTKSPTLVSVTEDNDIFVFHAIYEKAKMNIKGEEENQVINRFTVKQTLTNIFQLEENTPKVKKIFKGGFVYNEEPLKATRLQKFNLGLVVGSNKGNILFIEKNQNNDYVPVRYTMREKEGCVTGLTFSSFNEDTLAISFDTNEIAYMSMNNIFQNLRNEQFEIQFNIICDGFHSGPITTMDVALQRPIIITTSKYDKTVRVWNYLTGHCEYCKIILEEKDNNEEKELNILSVAIHPNGYYIAISDLEMIRFFHLCYKELRFYNNDQIASEPNKANCTMLKFSNGGHLLAALCDKKIYIIRSFSRETVKIINTPHSGNIVSIFFHPSDNFIYSCGTDGFIVQYNLFDFNYLKITAKFTLYANSVFSPNYDKKSKDMPDNIISCGFWQEGNVLTNVNFDAPRTEEISQCKLTSGYIDEKGTALYGINTKRYNINSIALGTEDGKLCLYNRNVTKLDKYNTIKRFDKVHSHKGKINFLYYSRDTNLLFSAGEDGNLFTYAIYEYPDGETIAFEDNKIQTMNQLNSILDEGLGDNVLLNLFEIFSMQDKLSSKTEEILRLQRKLDDSNKTFEKDLREKIAELNHKRENEVNDLKSKIDEMKISTDSMIEEYEKKIENINQENRKKFNEREGVINEKIEELNKQINELREKNGTMQKDYEKALKDNNYDQLSRFRELEYTLQKKIKGMSDKNTLLTQQLNEQKDNENRKINILENENNLKTQMNLEKFEKSINNYLKEIEEKGTEIVRLNEKNNNLEKNLLIKENTLKQYMEDNERYLDTINSLRKQLENKEAERDAMTKKLSEAEENLQEKAKLENFSNNLKNELYKKNIALSAKFNNELAFREELKDNTKSLEKQLEDTINLLLNREKEMNKQKILIEELKKKWNEQRKETNLINKDFQNLLRKIYETFQSNDKQAIYDGIKEIYHKYISDDAVKNFNSDKLNKNVRAELEKQIDHLQNELENVNVGKNRREKSQVQDYRKKMKENSLLIEEMTRVKKMNNEYLNQIKTLKFQNLTISNELSKLKKSHNLIIPNTPNTNNNNMTATNLNMMQTGTNASIINNNSLYTNISTNPSEMLPMLTYGFPIGVSHKADLKNMKNRIFKPGNLSIPNEKILKYNEMKKIIEGKNDIIQRLSAENDFLRQISFNTARSKLSTSPLPSKNPNSGL